MANYLLMLIMFLAVAITNVHIDQTEEKIIAAISDGCIHTEINLPEPVEVRDQYKRDKL